MEKNTNIQQTNPKKQKKKQKQKQKKQNKTKINNINHLIMALIKMRLLIFLILSRYGLACKYGTVFQLSMYNWMQNCIL